MFKHTLKKILVVISFLLSIASSWIVFDLSMMNYSYWSASSRFWYWHEGDGLVGIMIIYWGIPALVASLLLRVFFINKCFKRKPFYWIDLILWIVLFLPKGTEISQSNLVFVVYSGIMLLVPISMMIFWLKNQNWKQN